MYLNQIRFVLPIAIIPADQEESGVTIYNETPAPVKDKHCPALNEDLNRLMVSL